MAGLRKGHCYTRIKRAYTRKSKYKKKSFIRAIPDSRVVRYDMGDPNKKFSASIDLISKQDIQLRHNSLESSRLICNRRLDLTVGKDEYYFKLRVFPHHALRENKILGGNHADRIQTGMGHPFGKVIGIAAQVKKGQKVFTIRCDKSKINEARKAMSLMLPRMPGKFAMVETILA